MADTALALPLTTETVEWAEGYETQIFDGNGHEVATLTGPFAETRATAIVNAVNGAERMREALEGSVGYLLNAKIDLETGATKATAIKTIEGGLKMVRAALKGE